MAIGADAGNYLDRPLNELLDDISGTDPVPAAGSVVAVLGALAAALAAKVAHRSASRLSDAEQIAKRADGLRNRLEPLITADAIDYAAALATRGDRAPAMLSVSNGIVLMAETAAEIAELASDLARNGNQNLHHDAAAAVQIAAMAAQIAAELTGANVGESALSRRAHAAVVRAQTAAGRERPVT